MYASSSMTFLYKYFFTPIFIAVSLFNITSFMFVDDQIPNDWLISSTLMTGWAIIWLIILMIRLQRVKATHENLVIKSIRGRKSIKYKDIEWVTQFALINPDLISLKYFDEEIGEFKKILIMPSLSSQMFRFNILKESELIKFIRQQIIASKPDYSEDLEPSRWLPIGLILIPAVPLILIMHF